MSKGGKLLFVYDTMQGGYSNNMVLQDCTLRGSGKTVGNYRMWHADGVVRVTEGGEKPVHGEVYALPGGKLDSLDKMEGLGEKPHVGRIEANIAYTNADGASCEAVAHMYISTAAMDDDDEWEQLKSGRVQEGVSPDEGPEGPGESDDESDDGGVAGFQDTYHPSCELTGVAGIMQMMEAAKNGEQPADDAASDHEPKAKRRKAE